MITFLVRIFYIAPLCVVIKNPIFSPKIFHEKENVDTTKLCLE